MKGGGARGAAETGGDKMKFSQKLRAFLKGARKR
jgi:hypothetical protein